MPQIGSRVRIRDGTFEGFDGILNSIDADHAVIIVSAFGRDIPVTVPLRALCDASERPPLPASFSVCENALESYELKYRVHGFPPVRFNARIDRLESSCRVLSRPMHLDGDGEWVPRPETVHVITDHEWEEFSEMLTACRFWELETRSNAVGLDGASWRLEGLRDGRYQAVERWQGGEILSACEHFAALAGMTNR